MPKSDSRFVNYKAVKKHVSITQILERYGLTTTLRQDGENLHGPCPFHDSDPTQFIVSLARNCWICMGNCKSGGSILDFVAKKEAISIRQSARLIAEWFP